MISGWLVGWLVGSYIGTDELLMNYRVNFFIVVPRRSGIIPLVSQSYAGRASSSSVTDLFITMLSMGKRGLLKIIDEREVCRGRSTSMLVQFA
jgi:hypothetical protein